MKSNFIKSAVAAVLALAGANAALALTPAEIQAGGVVPLYVSGATATDNVLQNLTKLQTGGLCVAGTLDIYRQINATGSVRSVAMTCVANFAGTGITSGTTKIAIFKESVGGSANGIVFPARSVSSAVIGGTTVTTSFIDILGTDGIGGGSNFATACATVSRTLSTLPAGPGTYRERDCGFVTGTASNVTVTARVPQAGISDVDPGTFVGTGGVTAADASALTRKRSSVAVTFNPVVSTPLFRALQEVQGIIGAGGAENTSSVAALPSLSSPVLRSIFNGQTIFTADQIYVNGVQLSSATGAAPLDIYVCRRGDTSGTMTSFKVHFLNQGCTSSAATTNKFVAPDDTACETGGCGWNATTYGGHFVFAGSGSGDVRSCIDYHSQQGRLAIGIASTEAKPSGTARYRYVKVDGAAPTLKDTMAGNYQFFTQNTFNDKFPAAGSAPKTIWDAAFSLIGSPAALVPLNSSWTNAVAITAAGADADGEADTGILDLPTAANKPTYPITDASIRVKPVNGQVRQYISGAANNCNLPYSIAP